MKVVIAESHNPDRTDPLGSHQYARLFLENGHNTLWFGPAVSPLHLLKRDALNRYRLHVMRKGVKEINGIKWIVPFSFLFYYNLPLLRSFFIGHNQYRFCLPAVNKSLMRAGFSSVDLLWCAGPVAYSLLDLIPHRVSCYRLADRLDQFRWIPPNITTLQKDIIRKVDFVIATSEALFDWAGSLRPEGVFYIPNGVSSSFLKASEQTPEDFPGEGKPVVTYVGALDTRFDLPMVRAAVKKLKELHFLIIGPLYDQSLRQGMIELQDESNFTWLGIREHHLISAYLQNSAVGIIPFYLNDLTEAVNPIKYYEYLACGLPVVAPPMRELVQRGGPLDTYTNEDEFCQLLRDVAARGEKQSASLRQYAQNNTWESRFTEIMHILSRYGL